MTPPAPVTDALRARRPAVCMLAVGVLAVTLVAPVARAQNPRPSPGQGTSTAASISEELFVEGRALMQEKQYEKACAKFQASHDLDLTATGTLLNLALCHEATGKTARAWAEFRQVAAESADRRPDRVAVAREHEERLFSKLSRLTIVVGTDARVPGLQIRLDQGPPIVEAAWGTAFPIDPGPHVLDVSAPGKVARREELTVGSVADQRSITITALADAPIGQVSPTPSPNVVRSTEDDGARDTRRIVGFAVAGVGAASIGVGLVFGLVASQKNSDAKDLCPDERCASQAVRDDASHTLAGADRSATLSNIFVGAGAVAAIGGAVLVVTAWPRSATTTSGQRWQASPMAFRDGGGFSLGGAF